MQKVSLQVRAVEAEGSVEVADLCRLEEIEVAAGAALAAAQALVRGAAVAGAVLDEEKDFEQRFSFFYDFDANAQLVGGTKDEAFEVIFERLTQDIFNASLANW